MKLSVGRLDDGLECWVDVALEKRAAAIAGAAGHEDRSVQLVLADDTAITGINRQFRNIDAATDVISFSYLDESDIFPDESNIAGEIYLSYETVEREANERGFDRSHLFLRVVAHGVLHIIGYDHETDDECARMEDEERKLLACELTAEEIEPLFT